MNDINLPSLDELMGDNGDDGRKKSSANYNSSNINSNSDETVWGNDGYSSSDDAFYNESDSDNGWGVEDDGFNEGVAPEPDWRTQDNYYNDWNNNQEDVTVQSPDLYNAPPVITTGSSSPTPRPSRQSNSPEKDNVKNSISEPKDNTRILPANSLNDETRVMGKPSKTVNDEDSFTVEDEEPTFVNKKGKRSKFATTGAKPLRKSDSFVDDDYDENEDYLESSKKSKGKFIAIGAGVLALAVAGLLLFHPFDKNNQKVGDTQANTNAQPSGLDDKLKTKIPTNLNFWESSGATKYPIELADWQLSPYVAGDGNILKNVMDKYASTTLAVSSSRLPSASQGFTSDPTKMKLSDGTLNPLYSSITKEDYQSAVETDIERLINPVFGNWKQYQYASGKANSNFRMTTINDMFTQEWLDKNKSKKPSEYVPVYADWNSNDYGMGKTLLSQGPRWMGNVESTTSNFTFDSKTQQYSSDVTVNIKYSAWAKDESTVTKTGVLKMHIITKTNNGKKAQVLISEASLKVS